MNVYNAGMDIMPDLFYEMFYSDFVSGLRLELELGKRAPPLELIQPYVICQYKCEGEDTVE